MEHSIKNQAKSDIFKELYPIIKFYIKKGACPKGLKKYYKKIKNFNGLIEDLKNKGINLVKDEEEYKKLVREILNEMLDDFIASEKDKKGKLKHIKEFNSFEEDEDLDVRLGMKVRDFMGDVFKVTDIKDDSIELTPVDYEAEKSYFPYDFGENVYLNEFWDYLEPYMEFNEGLLSTVSFFIIGVALYKFIKGLARHRLYKKLSETDQKILNTLLSKLKTVNKLPVVDLSDRFFVRFDTGLKEYDLRLFKGERLLTIDDNKTSPMKIPLTQEQYDEFLRLMQK